MGYVVWSASPVRNACRLDTIQKVDRFFELTRGVPFRDRFSAASCARMSSQFKKATGLTDDLVNQNRVKICSSRLVEFLRGKELENLEYLPLRILDHKGKVASTDYFVVNPLRPQDALDLSASKPTYNRINPKQIDEVEKLVIDERRLEPGIRVFRLKGFYRPVLIDEELAAEVEASGFVGPYFEPLDEFDV